MSFKTRQRGADFFKMLEDAATLCENAAAELANIFMSKSGDYIKSTEKITALEERQGRLYRLFLKKIELSFITPIDREDLLAIFLGLEKTMQSISKTAALFEINQIKDIRPDAKEVGDFILKGAETLSKITKELRQFKKSKELRGQILELGKIKKKADSYLKKTVKLLFLEERNTFMVLKWKSIYDSLYENLNTMENTAKIIEVIAVKNS